MTSGSEQRTLRDGTPRAARWAMAVFLLCAAAQAAEPTDYPDYGEGLKWHLNAAEAGDAEAQYRLARFYHAGIKTERDPAQARQWFARAAAQGHVQAAFRLAGMLQSGAGGPVDLPAARQGDGGGPGEIAVPVP